MRFSRFEPKGRLKQQIRFQTTFLLTNRHSNQTKTAQRHTHVGSTAGKTIIRSGGDTTLKGAQLIGKGVQADTRNLHIESVQDTETYQGKQQNGNVQVTVGYGFSASGSYSQSKIRADHASVTGQSGIYAGEDGYQIKVRDNTDLKGGIITSGKSAEDKGKNLFQTATLTHSDIQNHSRYEGKSFGIGASVAISGESMGQNRPADSGPGIRLIDVSKGQNNNNAIGYGSDGDGKNSTTRSGINTRNIHITDEAGQLARTGRTAEETEARIYTGIDTETAAQHTGRLKNSFDKDAVAKEINLQREVTQEFGKNAAQATAAVSDKLGNTRSYERYQAAKTLLEAELQNTDSETEKAAIRATLGQVNAYLSENQSRYDTWKEGGIGRSILHGAAGGLTTGSLGGILAGGGTSLTAPYLDKAAENLGPAGKAAVNALGGAAIGYAAGGNAGTAAVGANVDWNNRQLHPKETQILNKLSKGKSAEEQYRLKAAACALTQCAEGVPDFDPLYKGLKNLQDAGKQFVAEQNVLMRTGAFKYGTWNSLNDIRSSYDRAATKIKGAGNMGLGATTFVGSGAIGGGLCSTGLGCAAGGLIATAGMTGGYTQASEGSRQLFGTYQSDFGKKVVLSLGTPIEYEAPLVSDAKNLAVWGLETLITRKLGKITNPSTPENPRIKQKPKETHIETVETNKPPIQKRTETYFRVEGGGSGNKTSQHRITVNQDGSIKINSGCHGQLCVSTKGADHAKYYLSEKRPGGKVVVFEVDASLHENIMKSLVPQRQAGLYPNSPKITDRNTPGLSIELPPVWEVLLEKHSSKARVLNEKQFKKEFGHYEK